MGGSSTSSTTPKVFVVEAQKSNANPLAGTSQTTPAEGKKQKKQNEVNISVQAEPKKNGNGIVTNSSGGIAKNKQGAKGGGNRGDTLIIPNG